MSKYAELQQRLTVATERNRTNIERRDELLKQCKEDFDCDSIEELRALAQETKEKLDSVTAELSNAEAKAEQAIASVEDAVAGRVVAGGSQQKPKTLTKVEKSSETLLTTVLL